MYWRYAAASGRQCPGSRPAEAGQQGEEVTRLQQELKTGVTLHIENHRLFWNHYPGCGNSFSEDHGLLVDGIVGPQTRSALYGGSASNRSGVTKWDRTISTGWPG